MSERFGVFINFGAFFVVILLCIVGVAMSCTPSVEKPTLSHSTTPEGEASLETTTRVFDGDFYRYENNEVVCYGARNYNSMTLQCKWKDQK
jgi:multidrug efflux pump subunit AcrB